jgi:O-antigen/teichoic acid export membrane protein
MHTAFTYNHYLLKRQVLAFTGIFRIYDESEQLVLYSRQYLASILPFQVLLLGLPFVCWNRSLAMYITGQLGKPHVSSALSWCCVPVAFALMALLTPRYGFAGAAAAIDGTYAFLFCLFFGAFVYYTRLTNWSDYLVLKAEDVRSFVRFLPGGVRRRLPEGWR